MFSVAVSRSFAEKAKVGISQQERHYDVCDEGELEYLFAKMLLFNVVFEA